MQILELARRALEDQVSKCRHAQVGSTLQMAVMLSLLCQLTLVPLPLSNQVPRTFMPHPPPCLHHRAAAAHLILTVLPDHLQGTLSD